mgnify:FL=1
MSNTILPDSKVCTRCNQNKPLDQFSPNKLGKFGKSPACKVCSCELSKAYAQKNKELVAERKRAYRSSPKGKATTKAYNERYAMDHADELREKRIQTYHQNKDERREEKSRIDKKYRERRKDEINKRRRIKLQSDSDYRMRAVIRSKEWYIQNKDLASEKQAEYYKLHRERIKARIAIYQKQTPEPTRLLHRIKTNRRRARLSTTEKPYTRTDVEKLLALQMCKCANCKKSIKDGYHIDHRIPVAKGGDNSFFNIELLCPKCNLSKSAKLPHVFAQENGRLI